MNMRTTKRIKILVTILIILSQMCVILGIHHIMSSRDRFSEKYNATDGISCKAYQHESDYDTIGGVSGLGWVL